MLIHMKMEKHIILSLGLILLFFPQFAWHQDQLSPKRAYRKRVAKPQLETPKANQGTNIKQSKGDPERPCNQEQRTQFSRRGNATYNCRITIFTHLRIFLEQEGQSLLSDSCYTKRNKLLPLWCSFNHSTLPLPKNSQLCLICILIIKSN